MELGAWMTVATVCSVGAMSPGPSLAVVVKNTVAGGRGRGVACALGHGLGVGIYAFTAVAGLHAVVGRYGDVVTTLGALYLVWMGGRILVGLVRAARARRRGEQPEAPREHGVRGRSGFAEGFLIAFLNPKIAVFFLALLGGQVPAEAGLAERTGVAALAMTIDGLWYLIVAVALAASGAATRLARHGAVVDAILGAILVGLGATLLVEVLAG
ncbi:MAG: LysE family translocator [Planctomycetota bacterium]